MKRNYALVGTSLVVLAGCSNSHWRDHDPHADSTAIQPSTQGYMGAEQNKPEALSAMDTDFLREAAWGNEKEVELGRVAARLGADEKVREFGQKMVDDHTRILNEVKDTASNKGLTLDDKLMPEAKTDMDHLSSLTGAEFDKEYVREMVADHEKDVDAFDREARTGLDSSVRELATRSLPTIREHLRMIKDIETNMTAPKLGTMRHTPPRNPDTAPDDMHNNPPANPDQPPVNPGEQPNPQNPGNPR